MIWMEIKYYENDPEALHHQLDLPGIKVYLHKKNQEYCLISSELDIEITLEPDLEVSKRIAVKLVLCELRKKIQYYEMILNRLIETNK